MIKLVTVFKRRSDLALEAFERYWVDRHAPLVARLPGLRRYVQSQTIAGGYRRGEPTIDGCEELWFDDREALHTLPGTPELAAVREDETRLMQPSTRREIVTEDVVVKDGPLPAGGVKNIELVLRLPEMAPEPFHRYWIEHHGPLGASIPQVLRYVQSHTLREEYQEGRVPSLDGLALTWFENTQAMRAAALTPQYAETRADEINFVTEPLDFVITHERVLVG